MLLVGTPKNECTVVVHSLNSSFVFFYLRYPFLFCIVNFPRKYRNLRNAYAYAAFAEKPFVRKARCTKFAERLVEFQKIWKQMLQTRTTAQVLAQLDSMARETLWFWVRLEDGTLKKLPFSIRLLTWSCDCEGNAFNNHPPTPLRPSTLTAQP